MKKKLLVLDLDETLLFTTYENLGREPDFTYKDKNVYLRPGLAEFIQSCLIKYDVAIWTSAKSYYAKFIIKRIVSDISVFKFIWTRKKCRVESRFNGFMNEDVCIKDLNRIKNYSIEEIIMLDDFPGGVIPSENLFPADKYHGESEDRWLNDISLI